MDEVFFEKKKWFLQCIIYKNIFIYKQYKKI